MTAELHHPFPRSRYLAYLTSPEIAALPKEQAVVVLSIASVEQHGPHLPVITDSLVGQTVLGKALEQVDQDLQVWVAPPLCYGKSNEHRPYAGTLTLSAQTLAAVVRDIALSLARAGFRRLVLLNSHGGNPPVLDFIARDLHEETGMMLFSIMISRMGVDDGVEDRQEQAWGMHAGDSETSWVLALAPELVHMERTADLGDYPRMQDGIQHLAVRGPVGFAWLTADLSAQGVLGDPRSATAEKGWQWLDPTIQKLADVLADIAVFEMPARAGERTPVRDMSRADLLIVGGTLVTAGADGLVIPDGALAIQGQHILSIGAVVEAERVIDASGKIVFPGLVNTHTHLYQTLLKGLGDDLRLMEWLDACTLPSIPHLTPRMCYVAAALGSIESLRSGCTTVLDYMVDTPQVEIYDAILQAFDDVGVQGVLGRGLRDRQAENVPMALPTISAQFADCERLLDRYGTRRVWLAPGATWALELESLLAIRRKADERGARITLHTDEVVFDSDESLRRFGQRTLPFLEGIGFLGPDVLHAHCVHLTEADCAILARHGGAVSYNPVSNMYLGSGVPPIPRLLDLGVTVGLGADGAASNNSQDMLESLKVGALLPKVTARDPAIFTAGDALRIATSGGAAALGRDDFGTLEPGRRADLFIFDPMQAKSTPVHDPVSTLVYSSGQSNVVTTIVGGRVALDHGVVTGVDEIAILREAQTLADQLANLAGTHQRLEGRWSRTRTPSLDLT